MKAMILDQVASLEERPEPLRPAELADPVPGEKVILVKVSACGVCHTELDEIEGRTPPPRLPVIPGHQVVGRVVDAGKSTGKYKNGDRVGVAWIFSACGRCKFCQQDEENLCPDFMGTGRDVNGGYAEYIVVPEDFAVRIPDSISDEHAAPLLCAGAIGYRSLRLTGLQNGQNLGLTGFGASAHLVIKMAQYNFPETKVFVFARNPGERDFARQLGAVWAGNTTEESPEKLDSIIDTTPVWMPVLEALKNLQPGGRLIINAIRKERIDQERLLDLDYEKHLWREKEIKSVANVTRKDVTEFLDLAAEIRIQPEVQVFPLREANAVLNELKSGNIRGAKVLQV